MDNKEKFLELSKKLVALGETAEEFEFWEKIFEDLEEDRQRELIKMLEDELKQLESL